MTYEELKSVIAGYLNGYSTKCEVVAAFGLWQRKEFGAIPALPKKILEARS